MTTLVPLLSLAAALSAPATATSSGEKPPVPAIASRGATAADFWTGWAATRKYHLVPTKCGRMLLLVPSERLKQERSLDLVHKALARVDEILPPIAAADGKPAPSNGAATTGGAPVAWGAADRALETDTMVLILCRKPADFGSALGAIGDAFPYMKAWSETAKQQPGCILERPLFGACVDNVPGMEEWNPDNELVHRAAELAMIRRFGHQPLWIGLGVGWNVEFDVLKSIYCFPWRNSFVWATEHGGWENDLRRTFKKRETQPLAIDELASIKRGGFEVKDAALAWGTIRFFVQHHGAQLPALLMELQAKRDVLGRVPTGDGKNWAMAADYELPAEEQGKLIGQLVAADALRQAGDWFRQGANWKKPLPPK